MLGSIPDLLRLLAVPVFGWAAYRDVETRRVPDRTWLPLALLAGVLLLWQSYEVATGAVGGRGFFVRVAVSVGFVLPLAYGFWYVGGYGLADAKAFGVVAVLFPVYPVYRLAGVTLPLLPSALGVFSLTVLSNTVLAGLAYPLAVAGRNLLRGHLSPVMFVGKPVAVDDVPGEHGRLLEGPDGVTRQGLDLDALRMYLRWRDATLAELRTDPDRYRDPESLPRTFEDPGDGAVATDGGAPDDPWGARRFLDDVEGSAYGTTPAKLRDGLDILATERVVWISPGIPFLVPTFVGLVVALTVGDVLYALLVLAGLA
ncbi:prepilin peptidase [Haloarcula litorea]|uniref:prepilin peptidase n=1 Tax=Haloarcula litorea TaxID=3032579 RepID=UPI0023E8A25B|nr:prepilin peptidase [Halomicroarcula sp. GDY20]